MSVIFLPCAAASLRVSQRSRALPLGGRDARTPVKAFLGVMVDRGAKGLKVTACATLFATMLDVCRTRLSIDRR
jgi:hypothetical protein